MCCTRVRIDGGSSTEVEPHSPWLFLTSLLVLSNDACGLMHVVEKFTDLLVREYRMMIENGDQVVNEIFAALHIQVGTLSIGSAGC